MADGSHHIESEFDRNPYPGLRPFLKDEAHLFFGREEHVDNLVDKLSSSNFLAVIGPSGSGKSSLVRTGLLNGLLLGLMQPQGSDWRVAEFRPGAAPIRNMAEALANALSVNDLVDETAIEAILLRGPNGIAEVLQDWPLADDQNLIIVVDQFEEIFRFFEYFDKEEAASFVELLVKVAEHPKLNTYVVLTMRSDFIGECAIFNGLADAINGSQFLTPRLTREQARDAVSAPAQAAGGTVQSELESEILNTLSLDTDQLPILQHALRRLWDIQTAHGQGEGPILSLQSLSEIGGLQGALSTHADEIYSSLTDSEKIVAKKVFQSLTERQSSGQDVRRPTTVSELERLVSRDSKDDLKRVLDVYRASGVGFLSPAISISLLPDSVIDITHESLIRQWGQLKSWVDEERRAAETYLRIVDAATRWKQGEAALWSAPDLTIAQEWKKEVAPDPHWAKRYSDHYDTAMEFLNTSSESEQAAVEKEKKQQKRQLRRAAVRSFVSFCFAILGLGLASAAGYFALQFQSANQSLQAASVEMEQALVEAQQARIEAEKSEQRAEAAVERLSENVRALDAANARNGDLLSQLRDRANGVSLDELLDSPEYRFLYLMIDYVSDEADNTDTVGARVPYIQALLEWLEAEAVNKDDSSITVVADYIFGALITGTPSMTDQERQYWHNLLEVMNTQQKAKLVDILIRERLQLRDIDLRYEVGQVEQRLREQGKLEAVDAANDAENQLLVAEKLDQLIAGDASLLPDEIEYLRVRLADIYSERLGEPGFDIEKVESNGLELFYLRQTSSSNVIGQQNALGLPIRSYRQHGYGPQADAVIAEWSQLYDADDLSDLPTNQFVYSLDRYRELLMMLNESAVDPSIKNSQPRIAAMWLAAIGETQNRIASGNPFELISLVNNILWSSATDRTFITPETQTKTDILASDMYELFLQEWQNWEEDKLFFLDTLAVYYCGTGRNNERALEVYDALLERIADIENTSENGFPDAASYRTVYRDGLVPCTNGTVDPYKHDWGGYFR